MQVFVNVPEQREKMEVGNSSKVKKSRESKKQFLKEFAQGYLEAEKMKKMELLRLYENEYESLEDKDSFKAQYLESLIYVLKKEI